MVQNSTPLTGFMAVKNETELSGMREAHIRDGMAIVEFLSWLEKEIASGRVMTEVEIDEELTARRAVQKEFKGLSFPTIAGMTTVQMETKIENSCTDVATLWAYDDCLVTSRLFRGPVVGTWMGFLNVLSRIYMTFVWHLMNHLDRGL